MTFSQIIYLLLSTLQSNIIMNDKSDGAWGYEHIIPLLLLQQAATKPVRAAPMPGTSLMSLSNEPSVPLVFIIWPTKKLI